MSRVGADGVVHPVATDVFDMRGLAHIHQCAECLAAMPWLDPSAKPPNF